MEYDNSEFLELLNDTEQSVKKKYNSTFYETTFNIDKNNSLIDGLNESKQLLTNNERQLLNKSRNETVNVNMTMNNRP